MKIAGLSNIGKFRDTNQDAFATGMLEENCAFLVICDGMGGQSGGNVASQMVRDYVISKFAKEFTTDLSGDLINTFLRETIKQANAKVFKKAQENATLKGMGTTIVLALIQQDTAYIAHVGDSRAYLFTNQKLYQLTKDHSYVEMLIENGEITREEALHHPRKNQITRAVGVLSDVTVDTQIYEFHENEKILLCTDGLTNACTLEQMLAVLQDKKTPRQAVEALIAAANQAGGEDNITAIVAQK